MKMEISVADVRELINEIRQQPGNLFDMIRLNVQGTVGQYLSALMNSSVKASKSANPAVQNLKEVRPEHVIPMDEGYF